MVKLGFRRCRSDSNLYCHKSRDLYVFAYVDDLRIAGDLQLQQEFLDSLGKELPVKITGRLKPKTEASFLGRRLRNNGGSIDIFMPPKYIEDVLEFYGMNKSNFSPSTGSSSLKRIVDAASPLTDSEHSKFRSAVGKLLWLAFVRPDCSYAVKELSRDVKAPTFEQIEALTHIFV